MGWLLSLYIAATVFGVGVTTLDMLGLVGSQEGEGGDEGDGGDLGGDAGDAGAETLDAADAGDFDDAGAETLDAADAGDFGDSDADVSGGGEAGADEWGDVEEAGPQEEGEDQHSVAGHDARHRRNPILRILSLMRNLVYFSLGFGPTGWFALATGETLTATLLWSGGVGIVVLGGARILRRILRSELSSEIRESDLLMEKGEVTVTVAPKQLGRVRVNLGGAYVDRYARSHSEETLSPGTPIRVVDIGEDCVYVEQEKE